MEVARGVLAGLKPDIFPKLARRVALNAQRILLGGEPSSLPVTLVLGEQLTINDATARAIGVSPSWGVVTEAELIQQPREDITRKLDLYTAVQEALEANVELTAKDRWVAADAQNIREARANLLPQVNLSGLGLVVDGDRAEASMGQQPERKISGSVRATQMLYSEPAWANVSIQKQVHTSHEEERQQLRLDIMQAAATAYLRILRALTFERIQIENLKRTRSNLELARVREAVGSAGPAEVYRWESQIASNRKAVIEANTQRNLAEMELNRLLHRPLEEPFLTEEPDLDTPTLMDTKGVYNRYLGDKRSFRIFRAFLVQEGLKASPELAQLDAAIAAQERALRSATNRFWSPTVALQGEVDHTFSREGAGSEPLPGMDDTNWSIGLNVSFPLFEGGSKSAARRRALETLAQLRLERQALAERIEQRVRSAAHTTGASYAAIEQTLEAAEAANRSLDVVRDAYSGGMISLIELLDAQNAALVADLAAADAFYTFLIDLVAVGRAIGLRELTAEEREAVLERADKYLGQHK
jgi:outer membrane protein TolC